MRPVLVGLLVGFLTACAAEPQSTEAEPQSTKPGSLGITETDPSRCKAPFALFSNFHKMMRESYTGLSVEILSGDEAEIFISALNRTPAESDYMGEYVALFQLRGASNYYVTIIDRNGCVVVADEVTRPNVEMWREGRIPGVDRSAFVPSGFSI